MQAADDLPKRHRRRVLLGQLISYGDCLYATTVARQIKQDDPDCHLTWAISQRCLAILENNPDVDEVWKWPVFRNEQLEEVWSELKRQARLRQTSGEFDDVYLTQFVPETVSRWDGTLRSAMFRGYPRPITVPVAPVVHLTLRELENVRQFAAHNGLLRGTDETATAAPVILFECAPGSGQSFVTPAFALDVSSRLTAQFPTLRVILSSHYPISGVNTRILDGSKLSFRENAELSHYCSLLMGCSSGLTWLCTSGAARALPTIQMLTNQTMDCNPPSIDHAHCGLSTKHIIEMFDCPAERVTLCVAAVLQAGFASARKRFHERPARRHHTYRILIYALLYAGRYPQVATLLWHNKSTLLEPMMWCWHLHLLAKWLLVRLRNLAPQMGTLNAD